MLLCAGLLHAGAVQAATIEVQSGGSIQSAIDGASSGDVVVVHAGTYNESLTIAGAGIAVRAAGDGEVLVTESGTVLRIDHADTVVEGLVLDGQYGTSDLVIIESTADRFVLRGVEIRRIERDCVDIGSPTGGLIEDSLIHHCLNATAGRTDAHGVVGSAVQNLTIRGTEIHTFSGDAIQFDPSRAAPGWDNILVEDCILWLRPFGSDARVDAWGSNGFANGVVPGENAIDTKVYEPGPRSRLTIRNTIAYGFGAGLISNMAAFNLKEKIEASLDRVTVYDNEIAFRTRGTLGGANVTVTNTVVYGNLRNIRAEDDVANMRFFNNTFDAASSGHLQTAGGEGGVATWDFRNNAFVGSIPSQADEPGNMVADSGDFENLAGHNYHLASGSNLIDAGVAVSEVVVDRSGNNRVAPLDVGAYEYCPTGCSSGGGGNGGSGSGATGGTGGTSGTGASGGTGGYNGGGAQAGAAAAGGSYDGEQPVQLSNGCGCSNLSSIDRVALLLLVIAWIGSWRMRR